MSAQRQGFAVLDRQRFVAQSRAEKVVDHGKSLGVCDHGGIRVDLQKIGNISRVIRFHMLDHQIVRFPVSQHGGKLIQPLMGKIAVDRIHHGNLLVHNDVGIVRHAVGNGILSFKQVNVAVVDTDIVDISGYMHFSHLLWDYDWGSASSIPHFSGKINASFGDVITSCQKYYPPSATSRSIMTAKPHATPKTPVFPSPSACISGISSCATT